MHHEPSPKTVAIVSVALLASACWTTSLPELPPSELAFTPAGGGAPAGWRVSAWPMGELRCPDDSEPRFWLVHPETAEGPLPVAVVYHGDALDYVLDPDPADPLAGPTFRAPTALTADFATAEVFELLGMGRGGGTGALVAALASAGHAVILPSNCWGDLWAGSPNGRPNDSLAEGFVREGYTAAMFGWRMASDEAFAPINRVALPISLEHEAVVLIGLGAGGRAVGELLATEEIPAAAVMDSAPDDLDAWYGGDPALFAGEAAGLARVFADPEDAALGSVANAPELPARLAYVWSRLDPAVPVAMHAAAVARVEAAEGGWAWDHGRAGTERLADEADLAAEVVGWLVDGDE